MGYCPFMQNETNLNLDDTQNLPDSCFKDGENRGHLKPEFFSVRFTSTGKPGIFIAELSCLQNDYTVPGDFREALKCTGLFANVGIEDGGCCHVHLGTFRPRTSVFIRLGILNK